ncbi:UNVERIFIED_CONTAM: putative pentatricopeptide repeat-containing protein [Sesamum calycinum]|uniref:Pentatricopeptide repeat-containing protein n=1 Tax=Sesamum calycinum TaxID=2727403 RepID=A0AAW2NI27_9LAMI
MFLWELLLLIYKTKSGAMCDAIKQFRLMPVRNVVSWTAIISGFVQKVDSASALGVLKACVRQKIKEMNTFTVSMASLIKTYSKLGAIDLSEIAFAESQDLKQVGRQVHGYALKVVMVSEVSIGSSIFTMYSKCGGLEQSLKAFEQLERKDNVSWTSMIVSLGEHGCADKHTIIDDALVNMYSKYGDLNSAKIVFHAMPLHDQVSWSSLISGFAQRGYIEEVLQLFCKTLLSGITVHAFTISSVLGALAILSTPGIGSPLHAYAIKKSIESEASIGSSHVMMWTTMITSYANHGKGLEALQLFDLMEKSGTEPNDVTFVGVRSACSHTGLVGEGYFHLNSMIKDYGIESGYKHYKALWWIFLAVRAGRLEEAQRFVVNMPIEPNSLVWETLLAACKVHGNHEL